MKMKKKVIAGHIGSFREEIIEEPELCKYSPRCRKECPRETDCQIKRFYDKYPQYQELNIGSKI